MQSEIKDELASGKCFLQGHDKFGRAILLLHVKKHSKSLRDLKQCMRFLCYCLDKAIASADKSKNPTGKVTGIYDLEGEPTNAKLPMKADLIAFWRPIRALTFLQGYREIASLF